MFLARFKCAKYVSIASKHTKVHFENSSKCVGKMTMVVFPPGGRGRGETTVVVFGIYFVLPSVVFIQPVCGSRGDAEERNAAGRLREINTKNNYG